MTATRIRLSSAAAPERRLGTVRLDPAWFVLEAQICQFDVLQPLAVITGPLSRRATLRSGSWPGPLRSVSHAGYLSQRRKLVRAAL